MKKIITLFIAIVGMSAGLCAQPVTIAELTIPVSGGEDKELCYGFAAGDEILFSYLETNNKKIKEVEVSVWPGQSRYADYETTGARDQKINVPSTAVYCFRFKNAGLSAERVIRVSIRRRPATAEQRHFDTAVRWEERVDTFYRKGNKEWPGWIDTPETKMRRTLVRSDTTALTILEKTERVFSRTGVFYGSNKAEIKFSLPQDQFLPDRRAPEYSARVIGWAFWIGVGDEADRSYRDANLKAVSKLADAAAGFKLISGATGYGALALLALKGVSMFSNPPKGDNVRYSLWADTSEQLDSGNSITAYRRMETPLQGGFTLQLFNDNAIDGINVSVKVLAIQLVQAWRDEPFTIYRRMPAPEEQRQGTVVLRTTRLPFASGN